MNEDFAPFELAVKLKEKGFDYKCHYCYKNSIIMSHCSEPLNHNADAVTYSAPTIPQVLKWLREEKKIVISIFPHPCGWQADIYKDVHQYYDSEAERYLKHYYKEKTEISHSYNWMEICCIQYVLDNLI